MVPSRLNSITACARPIAAIWPASSMLRIFCAVMSVANLITFTACRLVEDRIVGSLNPDFAAALADPLVFGGLEFPAVEIGPERAIFHAVAHRRQRQTSDDACPGFLRADNRAHRGNSVGGDDGAVHVELDHGLRFADRGNLRQRIARRRIVSPKSHEKSLFNVGDERGLSCRSCTVRIRMDPYYLGSSSHGMANNSLIARNFNSLASQTLHDDAHASKMGRELFCQGPYRYPDRK